MGYVDKNRFDGDIYLGLPASFNDKIIIRRINLINQIQNFYDKDLDLVEVGCGNGATLLRVTDKFNSAIGYDISPLNQPEFENNKKVLNITNASFKLMDIEKQSNIKNQFDRLICFEVIEHLADDKNISKLFDMLKPGGKAAISVPNKWWVFETHGAKLPLLKWNRVPLFSWLPKPIHERYSNARIYTKNRIIKLFTNAGFQIKDVKYVTAPMDVLSEGKLKDFLTSTIFKEDTTSIPMFSTSIFLHVEKP